MAKLNPESDVAKLMAKPAKTGTVEWIGLRAERRGPLQSVTEVEAVLGTGLEGDHFHGQGKGVRQVTLIQGEHLDAVGEFLRGPTADPSLARRNIVVRGLNLFSLQDRRFRIGDAVLEHSGPCHPCSRMEENFGPGGYNAMRGHGGITAMVIQGGMIRVGDEVNKLLLGEELEEGN